MSTTSKTIPIQCRRNKPKSETGLKPFAKSSTSLKMMPQKNGESVNRLSRSGSKASASLAASTSKRSKRSSRKPVAEVHLPNCKPVIERLAYIMERLQSKGSWNCSTIAEHFEVNPRTIRRDLDFLQDRLNVGLDYDRHEHSYKFIDAPDSVSTFLRLMSPERQESRQQARRWMEAA